MVFLEADMIQEKTISPNPIMNNSFDDTRRQGMTSNPSLSGVGRQRSWLEDQN